MVAIVSGIRPGLELGSREVLGQAGVMGNALEGRNDQRVYVNAANGLLTVQSQDDYLAARGHDAAVLRTYNSGGTFSDDNADNWASGVVALRLWGAVNAVGSSVHRVDRDGSTAVYNWDAARGLYITTEGAGAHDTLSFVAADNQFEWRDGSTGAIQRFEGAGLYRLLSSKDTSGNALSYAYGAAGFLSSVTSASGESTFYDYVGSNLSQVRTVTGAVTTTRVRYGHDTSNRLATVTVDLSPGDNSVTDAKVYQTTYGYDGTSKRIASITQSDGTSLAFSYVDVGGGNFKLASVRDGLAKTSTFTYGAGFTTVADPLGLVTRYDHDAAGQLTKITAPAVAGVSASRQFAYNASGDVVSVTDGEGRSVVFQYDANGNQVLQRDALGNTVTRTFDARNQVLTETVYRQPDPDGAGAALPGVPATTRHAYDAGGRNLLRFTVSAEGRVTEHRYAAFGERVSSITYAGAVYPTGGLAADASISEATLGAWAATQDQGATQRVDIAYDARGQLQTRTTYARVAATGEGIADGSQTVERYVHDVAGLLLQTVSGLNGTTSHTYDGLGRVLITTDAMGQVAVTQYADSANKTSITLGNGLVTSSSYDAAGRLFSVQQSSTAGAVLGETRYFYDAGNRLRMTQDPTGVRAWMLYDAAGRKVADVDGNGTLTEHSYDKRDLPVRTMQWGSAVNTALLVDAAGVPLLSVTLDAIRPAGSASDAAVWRQYDHAQRLVREARSVGSAALAAVTEFRYDGTGRLVQTVHYANNVLADGLAGSVAPGAVPLPAGSSQDRSQRKFYDADGRLAATLDAEGYFTSFKYTAAGQLAERIAYANATDPVLRASGTAAQLAPVASAADIRSVTLYDGKGLAIAEVDGEGYFTEKVYDNNGNLSSSVRYANRVTATVTASSSVATIRPAAHASDRVTQRTYDALNRLQLEVSAEGVRTEYGYDGVGNLVSTVRAAGTTESRSLLAQFDLLGRLVGELSAQGAALLTGGQTQAQVDAIWTQYATRHAYDAAGRRVSSIDALGNRTLFFYDADGALTHTVNALGEVRESRYDARGRVIEQIAYANRISATGLVGGLVPAALGTALTAASNTALDSRSSITYTRDGRVAGSTDELGTVTTTSYNAFGDEIGSQKTGTSVSLAQTHTVDRRGLRTGTVRDALGVNAITSAVHDAFGRLVRSVDPNGNVREQEFDRLGQVVSTFDPAGALRTTSYDAFGRVLAQTDALGNTTAYAYDATARTMKVTTPEGIVTTTSYSRHGQVQSIADGKGQVSSYSYDRNGALLQTSTPLTTSTNSYDAAGRLLQTTDARGGKVAYSFDAANRVLTRRVDPTGLNLTTTYVYDGKGQRVSVTDANGVVTTVEYDRKGQVARQTVDPTGLNLQTLYTYDASGNTLTVRSPAGTVTQYLYDALGRRTQERADPAGLNLQRSWAYDRNGNVVTSTDARGNVTRYAYDGNDRLVFMVDPVGNLRQNAYDAQGRVTKTVTYATPISLVGLATAPTAAQIQPLVISQAAQDVVEHRVYDKDSRVAATVDGTGGVVKYTYDANGNVIARTAYANRITLASWAAGTMPVPVADAARDAVQRAIYDGLDRAIYSMDGIGAVVAQTYDGIGNVLHRTDYATAIATNTTFTQAGVAAAVAAVANAARDATVRNTYDAAGRLTWSVDGTGAVTQRVYDKNGNVVRQVGYATAVAAAAAASSVVASSADRATAMAYDNANRLVFQVDALRGVTEQVFDVDGRVVRRTSYATPISAIPTLGTAGTVAAIRTALVVNAAADRSTRYGYDAVGREALSIDALGAATETQYDAAGNVIATIAYANPVNTAALPATPTLTLMKALVTLNAPADRTTKFAYDSAGRLVYTVDPLRAVKANQYDGVGRLTRTTRHFNLLAAATANTAPAIAAAIVPLAASDRVETFSYNAASQLISEANALGKTKTYGYDALGRKMQFVNESGYTWTYTYDASGRVLSETTPVVSLTSASLDAAGNIVSAAATNAAIVTRLAYDALGNLTQRTEASGRVEERSTRYEYDTLGRQVRVIHPPVAVYNAAGDAITTNGATGVASRVETLKTLETRTFYDVLGNAVASRDVGEGLSQKAYDLLGRVAYDVDAMGFVTGHVRNAFGEVTALTRYGAGTTLAGTAVTQASQAASKAQVEASINAVGVDHSRDRALLSTYDGAGRVIETTEPTGYVYDSSASAGSQATVAAKKTRNTFDAFGQLVQVKTMRNSTTDAWATTTHYFDARGRQTVTIDALGYLTKREFDTVGNMTRSTEYATAVTGTWSPASYTAPVAHADDRGIIHVYDLLNRKTSEVRLNVEHSTVANGTSVRGSLTTLFAYDAVGNQTRVTDANNGVTTTYYDALGRVSAIAAPPRLGAAGNNVTPLTLFRRDAYGNVAVKTELANGAAASTATTFTAAAADAADRVTLSVYDSFGRSTQATDANGANEYSSYDAHGHIAKKWQGVTGNDGVTRTLFETYAYDKLGQLVESRSPASTSVYQDSSGISTVSQAQAGVVTTAVEYNAFGEVTRKGTQAGRQEYFEYDNAGRLWRTNTGDGVDRVHLYDLQGNVTAEIRSSGSGRDNIDIKGFANAQAAADNPYTRRVDMQYDALGRVTAKFEAARQELQGGVTVQRQFTSTNVLLNANTQLDDGYVMSGARNRVAVTWNSLSHLGSGDVKVYLEYRPSMRNVDENGVPYLSASYLTRSHTSGVLNGDAQAGGATVEWTESGDTATMGIHVITRLVVYKKDINGSWQAVIDQIPGYGANEITVAAPPNAYAGVTLKLRAAGSAGDTGWWIAGLTDFGNGYRFDARGLAAGNYEYRVTVSPPNESERVIGTGTVAITLPPLNVITTTISYKQGFLIPDGFLHWASQGTTYSQVFRYRPNGSAGPWSALAVETRPTGIDGVRTAGMAGGTYQFELLWTAYGEGSPNAHATGTFTVTPPQPAYWVPPVNLPHITGVKMGTGVTGAVITGYDESNNPIYAGGTRVPAIVWNALNANVAQYRVPGGTWVNMAIDNSVQTLDESGYVGAQTAPINGIPPGTYEFQVFAGSPPTAQATANFTIYAQSPGYWTTVYVQVPTYEPVIAYYAPVYETRYGTRTVSYQVWVVDSATPVIIGYDESDPIYLRDDAGNIVYNYTGHYETRYRTETYSYQVQVGQTPVYATDEAGNIIYETLWVTQAQQQWVEGTTPSPTLTVTTPTYTPGYTVGAVGEQYGVSVTTAAGTSAISSTEGSAIAQGAWLNGDARWLRPTVFQKTDRWGNVTEITDPRAAYWKTTYRYNANNQLVQQVQVDTGSGSPVSAVFYDKLGRQVAVKDANGYVNGQEFDASGNLVKEVHADGGVVTHLYNAFGDKVRTTDAMGKMVAFTYDKMGHMLRMTKGQVGVYAVGANYTLLQVDNRNMVETWGYDQLGRKLSQTNGNGETTRYDYDLAGNLVETRQPMGQRIRAAFDAQGRKIAEVDANGVASSWAYDYFGLLTGHMDLGGARYTYTYDKARQLTHQSSTRGQSITYSYDAAGQVTTIQDSANGNTTTYMYDLGGRKIRERVVQGGITYQDNHLAYDARGNLRDVADARAHVVMDYDRVGNRTRVATYVNYQGVSGETSQGSDRHFKYDAMNRQIVVDAVDAAGNLGTQGHQITYDKNGNRLTDMSWGNKVATVGGEPAIVGYYDDGSAIYRTTPITYEAVTGYSTEVYRYDSLDRLQSVEKDGTQIDVRFYDGADRVIQSGPAATLPTKYSEILNQGLAPDQMNGKETRINRYDANGRLMHQKVLKSDHSAKRDISWDASEPMTAGGTTYYASGYDAAGNVLGYTVASHESGIVNRFTTSLNRYQSYQAGVTQGVSSKLLPGSTTQQYDANGLLVGVVDSTQAGNNRTFVNDARGHALFVNQAGNIQRQLIVNGEVLGLYGVGVNANDPASGFNNNPNFANVVDFDFGYARVSASYPSASPGAYTVRTGDTLQSIAQSAYGDSALWYRIAEANGLASGGDLKVGQTLNIPNRVSTINNNASTFKPYDPSRIEGDKTPNLATPKPKKKSGLGQLLMVIVAIVVAVFTAGTALAAMGFTAATASTGALVAAGAIGGAAGSVASQVVGMATGVQGKFSWKGVALGAIGGGITAGLSGFGGVGEVKFVENAAGNRIIQAAVGNAVTQGISVATGLQHRFDWSGVAGSAVGAGAGQAVGPSFAKLGDLAGRVGVGLVAGAVSAIAKGVKVSAQQIAFDAFGNALGYSVAENFHGATTASPRFPDTDQVLVELNKPAPELPDLASMDALSREMATGYETPPIDPADSVLVVGTEMIGLGFEGRTAIIGAPTTTQEMLDKTLTEAMALRSQHAAAEKAQASTDRALRNMQEMADAYRAAGLSGATGDPADLIGYGPLQASANVNDPDLPGSFPNILAGLPEPAGFSSIKAIDPGLWEKTWGSPDVQHVLRNSITGQVVGQIANLVGKGVSAFRNDGYNPATLKHVHGVDKQRALQDTVIGVATLPIGFGRTAPMRAEVSAAARLGAEIAALRRIGARKAVADDLPRTMTKGEWEAFDHAVRLARTPQSWSSVRRNVWSEVGEAELKSPSGRYSEMNIARMLDGLAPRIRVEVQLSSGRIVERDIALELHHRTLSQRSGSQTAHESWNLEKVYPWSHADMDPHRFTGYDLLRIIRGPNSY